MKSVKFSALQNEALVLAREITAFVKENRYVVDNDAQEEALSKASERIQWLDTIGRLLGPPTTAPTVRLYLDNSKWVKSLEAKYTATFAARVETVRLKLVAAGAMPEAERWYTQCFMTELRITMLASYLVSAAFILEDIGLAPSMQSRLSDSAR